MISHSAELAEFAQAFATQTWKGLCTATAVVIHYCFRGGTSYAVFLLVWPDLAPNCYVHSRYHPLPYFFLSLFS